MTPDQLHGRLQTYLAHHGGEDCQRSLGPLGPLPGGWDSSLYIVTVQPRHARHTRQHAEPDGAPATTWVLKLYTADDRGREHATREWRALTYLHDVDHLVPRVVLVEPDAGHLGRPFVVMEHISGRSLWTAYEAAAPAARTILTRSFAERLVALHALDPQALDPAAAAMGAYGYIDSELQQFAHDSARYPDGALVEIVQWLEQCKQAAWCERPVILHRDYHPWNVLVDGVEGGERLWVLDWDWQVGDPRFDVAWACTLMQRSGHDAFAKAVLEEYGRRSGRRLDDVAYFEVLTTLRWLLNVLPAVQPDSPMAAAARTDFRAFLIEPVQRARVLLRHHTGIAVSVFS